MSNQYIKDSHGNILGWIAPFGNYGNQQIFDSHGNLKGVYHSTGNLTQNDKGVMVGTGNILTMLLERR